MLDYSRAGDIAVAVAVAVVVVVVAAAGVVVVVTIRILIPMIIVLFFHHRGFVIPVGCSACGGGLLPSGDAGDGDDEPYSEWP